MRRIALDDEYALPQERDIEVRLEDPNFDSSVVVVSLPGVGNARHAELFFIAVQLRNHWTWALTDTGSNRNLMSLNYYKPLLHQSHLRSPQGFRVLAGNGQPLNLKGLATFVFAINGLWCYLDFVVVNWLPLDAVLNGELTRPHGARLYYNSDDRNSVELEPRCPACDINKHYPHRSRRPPTQVRAVNGSRTSTTRESPR